MLYPVAAAPAGMRGPRGLQGWIQWWLALDAPRERATLLQLERSIDQILERQGP